LVLRAILVAGATVTLWSSTAPGQQSSVAAKERLAARICAADISARCAGVEGGQGRLRSCVKEHIKDFSQSCQARLAKLAAVRKACADDIRQNCATSKGPRRIETCLKSTLVNLSDGCKDTLAQAASGR
jgi:hypothetical protein